MDGMWWCLSRNFSSDKTCAHNDRDSVWGSSVYSAIAMCSITEGGTTHCVLTTSEGCNLNGQLFREETKTHSEFLSRVFEPTDHVCVATDPKRQGGSCGRDSGGKLSTCWAHTDTRTYLHTSIQHICTWRGRDGKSFQLSVGVFVCWLQIA